MPARGQTVLEVSFGPAPTSVLPRAVALSARHADHLEQIGEKTWRATFRLGQDEEAYGRALQLVHMVQGWRATTLEVSGSPEDRQVIRQMLRCARGWLRSAGSCRATFAPPPGRRPSAGAVPCTTPSGPWRPALVPLPPSFM